jgi:hypothetical protein
VLIPKAEVMLEDKLRSVTSENLLPLLIDEKAGFLLLLRRCRTMGSVLNESIENSRERLIEQLIAHNVYKIKGKHLFELPLSDLEHEYKQVQDVNLTI